jgi:replication factor A1
VGLIKEKSGVSEDEINRRVKEKISQLSDLVSKEGAAHIVANQMGISLMNLPKKLKINEIKEGMRNVEVVGKVTKVFDVREFTVGEREGKVGSLFIGDETGTIRVTLWGVMADNVKK